MTIKTSLTRRQALLLSGAAQPAWPSAVCRSGRTVLQRMRLLCQSRPLSRHATASRLRSHCRRAVIASDEARRFPRQASRRVISVRSCASAAAIRFRSVWKTISMKTRHCIGTASWCRRTSTAALTIRSSRAASGRRKSKSISQRQRTWFHPHPHGNTARQVYGGLAGMMIVSDGGDRDRGLPATYGVDDLPIVLQDKRFGRTGELVYAAIDDGHDARVPGRYASRQWRDRPVANVPAGFVRLRLLNAANARNFDLRFSDHRPFFVIAGDAGILPEPVELAKSGDRPCRAIRNPGEFFRWPAGRSGHRA